MAQWVGLEPRNLFPRRHSRLTAAHDSAALSKVVSAPVFLSSQWSHLGAKSGQGKGCPEEALHTDTGMPSGHSRRSQKREPAQATGRTAGQGLGVQVFLESDSSQD